ncbi:aspartate aminotransferase family protein [Shimia thalassica]|uniref:aspartate aminotransferase family protein n=1 Tax=Shimia thalassica TaxID=1715693 RepID=UPI002494BD61|nr:aspartate aminotransferase family protein [Shimia thalassica]MDO6481642.1 aspartate aminotransferase family protein [Shimia thalassica]MDO6483989.1 aspartate aminotransferase family protein [Shimia thalassica]MDO6522689.1 aspartate aminotransferase family protein [Shimia thalassica]MDO6798839.1 aspartate aminotransferase family protein [Shimia thalassica]MDP2494596.1 aspartate aminotransferase family protein [Shimia thalassica]
MKDSNFLKEKNAKSLWHPMAHPADSLNNPPAIITGAQGVRITDVDGHEVVDGVGGLWNVNLGFSCQPVKDAIARQLDVLPYYSTFRGTTNDAVIELSEVLRDFYAPDGLTRAFYTSGGSDSVETALRLARQYHKVKGEEGRTKFLSLKKGYHGTHMGGASVNGNANFRTQYEPLLPGCFHIPAPYTYRNPFNETDPEKLAALCLQAFEDEIAFQGAGTIAAFIMEPILGAGGVIPPHESFMPGVREICTRNGILLIADEVITAFGRTGSWTGSRHWGVQPDMMATAKAITNGYFPFGAVMIADHVAEVFENDKTGKAAIGHGYTYSGHPVGAAAALACLEETLRLNVKDNAAERGTELHNGLLGLMQTYDVIGDVRGGHGLMCAIELVSDRATKTPIDKASAGKIQEEAYKAGAMVRVSGPNIILSPPLVLTSEDVQVILSSLETGLKAVS